MPKIFEFIENHPYEVVDIDHFIAHLEYNLPVKDYQEEGQIEDISKVVPKIS